MLIVAGGMIDHVILMQKLTKINSTQNKGQSSTTVVKDRRPMKTQTHCEAIANNT